MESAEDLIMSLAMSTPNYGEYNEYNYSDTDDIYPSTITPIPPIHWAALVIYVIVFILGLPGNAMVVWMTGFEMKRTVNIVWFLNLAVADLLCCLAVPFSIMAIILRGHWPLGLIACKFISSILLVNMYASVLILTLISMDRCVLVIKPVWCQNKRSIKKASVACLVVWLLALLLSCPSLVFRDTHQRYNGKIVCTMNYGIANGDPQSVELSIAIFRVLFGFIIPFLIISVCYGVLIVRVNQRFTQSNKTMKVVVVVVIGFFVCWFPYHVAGLIISIHHNRSELVKSTLNVDPVLISVAFINSCINPIIYVLMGHDFKSKFKKSIKSVLRQVLADDQSQSFDSRKTKSTSDTKNTDTQV